MGCRDHVITAEKTPASAVVSAPRAPSLTASQRILGTDWVQANCQVPSSTSRATSGAPKNAPIRNGTRLNRDSILDAYPWSSASCRIALEHVSVTLIPTH